MFAVELFDRMKCWVNIVDANTGPRAYCRHGGAAATLPGSQVLAHLGEQVRDTTYTENRDSARVAETAADVVCGHWVFMFESHEPSIYVPAAIS